MRNRRKRNARRAALTTFFVFTKKVSCAIRALPRYPGRGYRPLHPRYATTTDAAKLVCGGGDGAHHHLLSLPAGDDGRLCGDVFRHVVAIPKHHHIVVLA